MLFFLFGGFSAALFEFVDATSGIDELLLARIKRMASAADFHVLLFFGRTSDDHVLARTDDFRLREIGRVNVLLHGKRLSGNSFDLVLHFF